MQVERVQRWVASSLVLTVCTLFATGMAILLTGVLVERFAGLVPGQVTQSPATVWRIGLLYAVAPAGLILAAAAAALPYRIGRRETAAIQSKLDQRRAAFS